MITPHSCLEDLSFSCQNLLSRAEWKKWSLIFCTALREDTSEILLKWGRFSLCLAVGFLQGQLPCRPCCLSGLCFSFWFSLSTYPAFPMIATCPISSSSAAFLAYLFTQVSSPYWKDMDNMEAGCAICTGSAGEVGHEPDVWRDTCPACWVQLLVLSPWAGSCLVWVDLPCELCSALCATGLRETGLYWHCSDLDPWGWRRHPYS